MPVKRFGIYLAFDPLVELRGEGLGRLLAAFLRVAARRDDLRFVIACPRWFVPKLKAFFKEESISAEKLEFLSTDNLPVSLRVYLARRERRARKQRQPRRRSLLFRIRAALVRHRRKIEWRLASAESLFSWAAMLLYLSLLGILLLPVLALGFILRFASRTMLRLARRIGRRQFFKSVMARAFGLITEPDEAPWDQRLFQLMQEAETARLIKIINARTDIQAWYSPAAFWPAFNRILGPRLMCVPDVVIGDFPVGFGELEPELERHFDRVERAVIGGDHFQTYSSHVKWSTLVERYSVSPEKVSVVPHAAMDLASEIDTSDRDSCERLLRQALERQGADSYTRGLAPDSLRFLFYASQFRPNKNLMTLLRAYDYLVREKFIPRKLILTGNPHALRPISEFIAQRKLEKDVICLQGLNSPELSACYHLADLAVNPSLSEGGCPFTLTEALSVGTPVVMARIPVTEEVVTDPQLRQIMLFDPYDWRDAAARIEWALNNRPFLLNAQKPLFNELRRRKWDHVVDEVVGVMERIAGTPDPALRAASR
jgi:glycosyltransferase involved in cell wall biosynthesis